MSQPKIIVIFLFILLVFCAESFGQTNGVKYLSTFQSSMGSNTSVIRGIRGITGNPAATYNENTDFSVMVNTEQRYFLSSLNSTTIAGLKRIGEYDFLGLSVSNFGIDEFKERRFSINYSRLISKGITIGSTTNYYLFEIEEYGTSSDFDLNFGLTASLSKSLTLGVAAFNILSNEKKGYLREQTEIATGLEYTLSPQLAWIFEIKSNLNDQTSFSTGIDYSILDQLNFQIGLNTLEKGISIGFSYKLSDQLSVNAANRSTQNLGITPGLGLIYQK